MTTKVSNTLFRFAVLFLSLCAVSLVGSGCGGGEQKSEAPAAPPAQSPPTETRAEPPTPLPPVTGAQPTPPAGAQPQIAPGTSAGTISGRVRLIGTPPPPQRLKVGKDTDICGTEKIAQTLIVGPQGGVQNAVVFLASAPQGTPPEPATKPLVLDQKGCEYSPHILLVPAGVTFDIVNSDDTLHNIHTYSDKNASINRAQPKFKKVLRETFPQPEIIRVKCDVHDWMTAWVVVQGHPYYAKTDAGGAFTLANVPPGTYELKMWHETLGEKTQSVTVQAGKESAVTFEVNRR